MSPFLSSSAGGGKKHMIVGLGQGLILRRCRHAIGSLLLEKIAVQQNLSWCLYPTLGAYVAEYCPQQRQRQRQQNQQHDKNKGYADEAKVGQKETMKKRDGISTANGTTSSRDTTTILVWPLLPYNLSGLVVSACANRFLVEPRNITIIHDDLDVKVGKIKWRTVGSAGSSNKGVRSILQSLGTDDITRLRIGIGRPTSKERNAVASYVLDTIPDEDLDLIQQTCQMEGVVDKLLLPSAQE
eukprot:CAMPEP_0170955784 /NCGR_PEP_ID=MMETSP0735-20130129/33444_1 /TAXON_ID=186038 /ORGANISM="Fragilariopsis kerguelensis, Strain L26-C5" /LENGTH=240 /DNA_ID=CAMNT_0011367839 /DNA_START=19 /DNA_END=741 /DNA_ORIENTATION=+